MNGMAYTDVRNEERKEDQWLLGVCRIRRKGIGRRPDETLGFGFLVKDLIIPNPTSSFKYCLITATQSIDAKDSSQSYYLEFKKLNSKVKTVPLRKIADLQEAFRAYNLLFIRLKEPPSKCYKKKESIFTYRPFELTNENQIASTDLLCVLVEDKEKSFDAIDLKIQRRTEQNSDKITFEVIEYQNVLTTRSELIRNKNRMPDGGVILMHQENKDKRFKAAGCLDFADDGSICPVFFPLIPINTCQDGSRTTNATFLGGVTVAPTLTPESAVVAGIRDATAPITVTVTAAPDHGEASENYENCFVSEILQECKCKGLLDKLIRGLGNTANPCIANWEHLACSTEVNAPFWTRLKCKLPKNYSQTLQLFEVLAGHVYDDGGVVTIAKLVKALRDDKIGRNDVAGMIEAAYLETDDGISIQTLNDFLVSNSNSDLVTKIITKLDDQSSRVNCNWKHLGIYFGIKSVTLNTIEYCFPHNPAKNLMEYLISEQKDLTVENLYQKVKQNLKGRADVLCKLEPFLKGDDGNCKLLEDVINLDTDLDEFYICLNKKKDWKYLAIAYDIPRKIYKDFDTEKLKSPAEQFFEWLVVNKTKLTVGQLCNALERVKRNDLVREIREYFKPRHSSQHLAL
ncbi:uncharacterized protein [Pocillopora verrucosa]|uniref:uncharacterized protein isoform X1 n=1 Tax=Pocillopora verrucosa TaxID=203993 RepID=UPI003340B4DA